MAITIRKKFLEQKQEFIDSLIAWLENMNFVTHLRLQNAIPNFWVGEDQEAQDDWVWETKKLIEKIELHQRPAWKTVYDFVSEHFSDKRYKDKKYGEKILDIAKSKGIGEYVWIL